MARERFYRFPRDASGEAIDKYIRETAEDGGWTAPAPYVVLFQRGTVLRVLQLAQYLGRLGTPVMPTDLVRAALTLFLAEMDGAADPDVLWKKAVEALDGEGAYLYDCERNGWVPRWPKRVQKGG